MATGLDISGLTMNPEEVQEMAQFIVEQVFDKPEMRALHNIETGIKMKEQIVFASLMGKMGLKSNGTCGRQTSGAKSTLTEKYWEPQGVEDTLVICPKELDSLFKAYFSKITSYKQRYEIEGSDLEVFLTILVEEAIAELVWRIAWHADEAVAIADAGTAGLKSADDIKFYDYIDGLWAQIIDSVTAGDVERYTISKNALTTTALQLALDAGESVSIFEGMWAKADSRLKSNLNSRFYVSNEIFENYRQYLQNKGENSTIEYTLEGFSSLKWNGKDIINMENVWDRHIQADFVDNTTNNAYYLPNRAVLTVPENIPIGTLNESDLSELEMWYDRDERENKIAFGFDMDAKLLESYMIVTAY